MQENEIRNQQILGHYYNNITNHRLFENAVLDLNNNEFYYENVIIDYIKYRNNQLLTIENLNTKIGLLKPFNSEIKQILIQIVLGYSKVFKWKDTNTNLHETNLRVVFNSKIAYLENDFIRSIEENLICNPILAFRLNEYCIMGFKSMISFLKSNLFINFEESPLFPRFQHLVNKYESLIDVEKMKVFAKIQSENSVIKEPQQINNSVSLTNTIFIETTSIEKFKNYLKLHIVDPYADHSYLFQRMLKEKIILKIRHIDFANWLFENNYIGENVKDIIFQNEGFRSLNKSSSAQRENNFNNVFNI